LSKVEHPNGKNAKVMVIHIALFKWRKDASQDTIERAMADVRVLKDKIDGIIEIYCGNNFSPWSGGFTHAVIVQAKDKEALDDYRKHPDHVDVAQRIEKMEEKSLGVDFEV